MVGKDGSRNIPFGERVARLDVTRSSKSTSVIDDDDDDNDDDDDAIVLLLVVSVFFPNPVPVDDGDGLVATTDLLGGPYNFCNSSSNHARNSDSAAPSRI